MNDKQAEDKRYIIPLAKELFEPKHRKLISNPLGLFAWLVDKTTKEVIANNGEMEGLVLGGAPITYTDIAKVFGRPERTVRRWKALLEDWKYIRTERTNHQGSLRWTVRKSKKFKKTPTEQRPLMDTAAPEQRPHLSSPTATFVLPN